MDFINPKGCVNFRDVGKTLSLIAGRRVLPEGRLLRGGKIDEVTGAAEVCHPATIINLRTRPDPLTFGARVYHFPVSNDYVKYETENPEVRHWLNSVLSVFADTSLPYPVMVHCLSGKDRTGVLVAALLQVLGVPDDLIVKEYMFSEGEVKEDWIRRALAGVGDPLKYFGRVNIPAVRKNFFGVAGTARRPAT